MRALAGPAAWLLAAACAVLPACKRSTQRSPEALREAYVATLPTTEANRAYDLLAPEVQATVSREAFASRWKASMAERASMAADAQAMPSEDRVGMHGGVTVHAGGRVLTWSELDGDYYVVDGLPRTRSQATPAEAVRSLIAAVQGSDLASMRALLSDDLAAAMEADWEARVEAIETALEEPGSIELSADLRQAQLRYAPGRTLNLEQTPSGWRITALE